MSLILEDDMYIIAPSNLKKKILLEQAEIIAFTDYPLLAYKK